MMAKTKTKRAVKIPSPKSQRAAGDSNSDAETSTAPDLSRLLALGTKAISLSDLDFLPDNPMEHSEESIEDMRDRLRARGQLLPLVVNARSGRPVVVGGNRRLQAMLAEGWTHAAVVEVNMADDQAMALALELNALQDQSWHKDLLAKAMKRLDGINLGERMDVVMSRLAEAQKLIPGLGGNGQATEDEPPQIDRAAELQKKWKTAPGQLWLVPSLAVPGKSHRVLCGDSTKAEDVGRVMGGELANGSFTSPPYAEQRKEQYGGTSADEYVGWWAPVQSNVRAGLKDDGSFFINIKAHCEDGERHLYVMDLVAAMRRRWKWRYIEEFCWLRNPTPKQVVEHFKQGHEPVFQFAVGDFKFRPDSVRHVSDAVPVAGGAGVGDTGWSGRQGNEWALKNIKGCEPGLAYPSTVLDFAMTGAGVKDHPAAFPVALPEFFIKAFSDAGDCWFDPFLGAATTIVAAEQLGRLCYGIEISPAYVAVILERLEKLGLTPRLEAHA